MKKFLKMFAVMLVMFLSSVVFALAQTGGESAAQTPSVSPEFVVTTIIGVLATLGVTQLIKSFTGLYGFGATVLSVVVSFVIGFAAVVIQVLASGDFSTANVATYGFTIFTTATIAYRALQKVTAEPEENAAAQ